MKRPRSRIALIAAFVLTTLWAANSSLLVTDLTSHTTRLLAHRGVHHVYTGTDRSNTSCQASPVGPITHDLIENTIPSMQAAFQLGADVVELDLHLTSDDHFAVFHDWTLDCRTDGTGVTHEQDMGTLKTLDAGYRLDDGTQSYPLRGKGIGLIPTLPEVLAANPNGAFLINFKSKRADDGAALADLITGLDDRSQIWGVYGGAPPTRSAQNAIPGLRGFDRASLKTCLTRYVTLGWSGYIPTPCRNTIIIIPQTYTKVFWGWPHRFTRRMTAAGTTVILSGPNDGSWALTGIDTPATLAEVPNHFDGVLWTNRIDWLAPQIKAHH